MTRFPDPAGLYPDVAASGSLAAALRAVAGEQGLSLGEVLADQKQQLYNASVTSATPLRGALGIAAGAVERCWVINGWGRGIWLISGKTQDLAEVARAAQLWRDGAGGSRALPGLDHARRSCSASVGFGS